MTGTDGTAGVAGTAGRTEQLRARVEAGRDQTRHDLERLVGHASVAFPGFDPSPVLAAADAVADTLRQSGFPAVELLDVPGGYPAVWAEHPAPPGAPTVLLYAHYDVQPAGDPARWDSPAFTPTLRGGRMYGRGAADDKSGIVAHAGAMRALDGHPPVGVKVIVEGEEETVSHLEAYVIAHPERFAADVVVVADAGNLRVGEPVLTTALRGDVSATVTVRTLAASVHSGLFGGPAPDALMALVRILAALHDDQGEVAVPGLRHGAWPGSDLPTAVFRQTSGLLEGVELVGSGTVADRLWAKPSVTVIGLDAPRVDEAANILVPEARARASLRIVPGQDPQAALAALETHVRASAPWGAHVEVTPTKTGAPFLARTQGPGYAAARQALELAYGRSVDDVGMGGSIPLLAVLAEVAPQAEIILWGAEDVQAARIHSENESVDLDELTRLVLAEALLLDRLGQR